MTNSYCPYVCIYISLYEQDECTKEIYLEIWSSFEVEISWMCVWGTTNLLAAQT